MEKPCCHSSNTDWLPEGEGPVEVEQAHDEENHALIVGRSVNRGAFKLT